MHRTKRLFQIMQLLRCDRACTIARLAAALGVSEPTLYRDIADLVAAGVPIESEAGAGYRLSQPFNVPPKVAYHLAELRQNLRTVRQNRIQGAESLEGFESAPEEQSRQDHLQTKTARPD
jgi:predicted DNA-binding transcriptional regulator YafY